MVYLYYYSMMMDRYGGLAGGPFSQGETLVRGRECFVGLSILLLYDDG